MRRKKNKQKLYKKNVPKKNLYSGNLLLVLAFITLLGLFWEVVKTVPVGAKSEYIIQKTLEVPRLNPDFFEEYDDSLEKRTKYH